MGEPMVIDVDELNKPEMGEPMVTESPSFSLLFVLICGDLSLPSMFSSLFSSALTMAYLREIFGDPDLRRPIFPNEFKKTKIATSLWSESDCSQWLNSKANGSVLYVSFGSYAHVSKHYIVEIAHGLSVSEVDFVWVLRPDIVSSDDTDILPVGFEDSVKERGLIVSWCHQIGVFSHPEIGGFLIHCGWNSTMESMWCGVRLICFPLLTDQFTNRKLVVDDWKLGINFATRN